MRNLGLSMLKEKRLNRTIAVFLCLFLLAMPTHVHAEEGSGKVTSLKEGDVAPYDGILFDGKSAARLVAEKDYEEFNCKLKIEYEVEKIQARHSMALATCKASFDALKEQNTSLLDIRDEEIKRLQELALKNPNNNANWWFAGGAVAGIITSIAIFYAAVETSK